MEDKRHYVLYYDLLNIMACICVIYMHCNGAVHTFENTRIWKESLLVDTLAYWAVPIFFMLSGATLLNYREKYSTKIYFQKRIVKTFVPYVLWNFIRILEEGIKGNINLKSLNPIKIVEIILNNEMEGVYWFFIPLFMVYLSIPVLSVLKENRKLLIYMVGIGLMTYSILPFAFSIMDISYNSSLYFPMTGGYIIFVVLGYLLSTEKLKKIYRYEIYCMGIVGILIRYMMTYVVSIKQNELNKASWGYLNIPSVLLAVAVFVFFKYVKWENVLNKRETLLIIRKISAASFGIYLIHMIVIRNLLYISGWYKYDWKWRYFGPIIVYLCALTIVLFLKKIPILKKLVP